MPLNPQKGVSLFDSIGAQLIFTPVPTTEGNRAPVYVASEGIAGEVAGAIVMQLGGLDPTSPIFSNTAAASILHPVAVTSAGAMLVIGEDEEDAASTKIFSASTGINFFTINATSVTAPQPVLSIRPLSGQTTTIFLLRNLRLVGRGDRIFWQVIYNGTLAVASADITGTAISLNILTVQCVNSFTTGQSVVIQGTAEAFLNGQTVSVIASTGTEFIAEFVHANFTNNSDTGTASVLPTFQDVNVNSGVGYDTTSTVITGGEVLDSGYLQFPDDFSYQAHFGFTNSVADTITIAFTLMVGARPQPVNASMRWTERATT